MVASPIRLETGDLGCPHCKYILDSVKSPFYLRDEYVGHFDSLSCSICNFHLFTAKGYELAIKTAKKFDFINSKIESEIGDHTEEQFTLYWPLLNSNSGFRSLFLEKQENPVSEYNQPENFVIPPLPLPQNVKTQKTNY